jgi:tetratricopeptide (TPR) repeat protein
VTIWRELGGKRGLAAALQILGVVMERPDRAAARSLLEESLAIWRDLNEPGGVAQSLYFLGSLAHQEGDFAAARSFFEESLAIWRQLGRQSNVARPLSGLGRVALSQGDTATARALLEESLEIRRQFGRSDGGYIWCQSLLGLAVLAERDEGRAMALFKESLERGREVGSSWASPAGLEGLARVAAMQGQSHRAARLFGAAACRNAPFGLLMTYDPTSYEQLASTVRAALGEEAFAAAWEEGQAMTLEQAIEYALAETGAEFRR